PRQRLVRLLLGRERELVDFAGHELQPPLGLLVVLRFVGRTRSEAAEEDGRGEQARPSEKTVGANHNALRPNKTRNCGSTGMIKTFRLHLQRECPGGGGRFPLLRAASAVYSAENLFSPGVMAAPLFTSPASDDARAAFAAKPRGLVDK